MIKWNEVTWYSRLGAIILFLIVIPVVTFIIGQKYQEIENIQEPLQIVSNQIKTSNKALISYVVSTTSVSSIEFKITKPVVFLSGDKSAEGKINAEIETNLKKIIADYQRNLLPCKNVSGQICKTSVDITSTTSSSRFNSLSIEIDGFLTSEVMAHPDFERFVTRTYDLAKGEEKKYYEVLGIDGQVLWRKLSDLSRQKLKEMFGSAIVSNDDVFLHGTDPRPENYEHVLIGENGLRVLFSYYQIGSRPFGAPEVFITYKELGL